MHRERGLLQGQKSKAELLEMQCLYLATRRCLEHRCDPI